ncbi:hypothetical protein TNCV_2445711 [Trichonephila clavipes]|nr:hypothetical protein TNCV_2445711 [Trichonephila clavipes]
MDDSAWPYRIHIAYEFHEGVDICRNLSCKSQVRLNKVKEQGTQSDPIVQFNDRMQRYPDRQAHLNSNGVDCHLGGLKEDLHQTKQEYPVKLMS